MTDQLDKLPLKEIENRIFTIRVVGMCGEILKLG